MRPKSRLPQVFSIPYVQPEDWDLVKSIEVLPISTRTIEVDLTMAQVNGCYKEQTYADTQRTSSGRVVSASMMRSAALPSTDSPTGSEPGAWSSAVGHASTGKSGRVIERLQGDIDRLHREKQVLKMRHDEIEKANETLATRNQYLQDRNSNYEQSHESNLRQLTRRERQVEDLKEELIREKARTARAEEQARSASVSEEEWREQANQASAMATQREAEYEMMASCRNMDRDIHQSGLDKIKSNFDLLLRQRDNDITKLKKLEIIAEQQRKTITQLEELTSRLQTNFKSYRGEIDKAITDLRNSASGNDMAMKQRIQDMTETTDKMRWVMKVDEAFNHNSPRRAVYIPQQSVPEERHEPIEPRSPSKMMLGFGTGGKHRRKASSKAKG